MNLFIINLRNVLSLFVIMLFVICCNQSEQKEQIIKQSYNLIKDSQGYRTLNKTGWIVNDLDEISKAFLDDVHENSRVLEIGAGFGYVSHNALEKGAVVYANDIDDAHTKIIEGNAPIIQKDQLHIIKAKFPSNMGIQNSSLDAIIAQRVLFFLSGPELEEGAKTMYDLLRPGGKVYISVYTPYTKTWDNFIPVYENAKKQGQKYPGYIEDLAKYNKTMDKYYKTPMHLLDKEELEKIFKTAGFNIDKIFYMDNTSKYFKEIKLDGREAVGLIASKH